MNEHGCELCVMEVVAGLVVAISRFGLVVSANGGNCVAGLA